MVGTIIMMTIESYSYERALEQVSAPSIKNAKLKIGDVLRFGEIMPGTIVYGNGKEVANDVIMCTLEPEGSRKKLSLREYFKMKLSGEVKHYKQKGESEVAFPAGIKIVKMEDRKDREGNVIYPLLAYKLADSFLSSDGKMKWPELVAGGYKEDHGYDPVQNYTIEIV